MQHKSHETRWGTWSSLDEEWQCAALVSLSSLVQVPSTDLGPWSLHGGSYYSVWMAALLGIFQSRRSIDLRWREKSSAYTICSLKLICIEYISNRSKQQWEFYSVLTHRNFFLALPVQLDVLSDFFIHFPHLLLQRFWSQEWHQRVSHAFVILATEFHQISVSQNRTDGCCLFVG